MSPSGDRLAWVVEKRGRRNVWVAVPPAAARQVTSFDEDDGMLIFNLSFSHDGAWLIFMRGGRVNNRGEVYNPRNLPDPVENVLWRVGMEGGAVPRVRFLSRPEVAVIDLVIKD